MAPQRISGLAAIDDRVRCFLVDQFGVLHDGRRLYDGVAEALRRLHDRDRQVVILTNSGKRSDANRDRVVGMGIARELFIDVVSSGEVGWRGIACDHLGPPFRRGGRAHIVGRQGDDYGFHGLDLTFVAAPEEADFLLILGSNAPATGLADYEAMLRDAAAAGIPALCCNPDLQMLTSAGLQPAPGAIAARYQRLGGRVSFIGKPHPAIYEAALRIAGVEDRAAVVTVGDSIDHDVKGAIGAGIATALVRTGVSEPLDDAALEARCAAAGAWPDYILPSFRW